MTLLARLPGWSVWIGPLMTLATGACGSSAQSSDDAGSDVVDVGSPSVPDVPVDKAGPSMDIAAAMEVAQAADVAPDVAPDLAAIDIGPGDARADTISPADTTTPADVLVGPPGFDDLIVSGVGLEMFEGKTVYLAIESSAGTFRGSAVVAGGQFVVTLPRAFDRDTFGMFVLIYVDLNGDGHCTAADVGAWSVFADNSTRRGQPQDVQFDPQRESPRLAGDCKSFP